MDLIFGDISYIVNDDTMKRFDIIGCGGHFTCVRNTELFTNAYKAVPKGLKSYVFREICQTDESMIFDEWGFRRILQTIPNIRMMDFYTDTNERICDVLPPRQEDGGRMCRRFHDDEEFYLKVKDGHVVLHGLKDKQWYEKEFAMCHLQKRKIAIQTDIERPFIVHRLSFLPETSEADVRNELERRESHNAVVSPTEKTKMDSIKKMLRQIKVSHKAVFMKCCRIIRDKIIR